MKTYTVKQLARLENRYRYYGREELLRLQDILFHRELGVPLQDIARALDNGGRNRLAMLEAHRLRLLDRVQRSRQLIRTIDRSIAELKGDEKMRDSDLYAGFAPEKQAEYESWLVDRHGEGVRADIAAGKARMAALGADGQGGVMADLAEIEAALAGAMAAGAAPGDAAHAPLLERHRAWVAAMWDRECGPSAYAGLADLYAAHDDFRARYETLAPGFAAWLSEAMRAHAVRLA